MEYKSLDGSVGEPVADICIYADQLVAAAYDRTLRVYSGHSCTACHCLPEIVLKMCTDGEYLICGSAGGHVFVLDACFSIVQSFYLFPEISVLLAYQGRLVVGSWGGQLAACTKNEDARASGDHSATAGQYENKANSDLKQETPEMPEDRQPVLSSEVYFLDFVKLSKFKILAAACGHGCIAVALENVVEVYDLHFTRLYSRSVQGTINSLAVRDGGMYIGLLNGKIYSEDFMDADKSYIFYAHTENKQDARVYHSINQLHLDTHLYSAGSDGRVCRWDPEGRRLLNAVVSCSCNVKKFVLGRHYIYAILEDVVDCQSVSKVVFTKLTG